jgi:hypothetical protein
MDRRVAVHERCSDNDRKRGCIEYRLSVDDREQALISVKLKLSRENGRTFLFPGGAENECLSPSAWPISYAAVAQP